jgi:hypothetical protein
VIREEKATVQVLGCDFPGCRTEYRGYSTEYTWPEWPRNWRSVRLDPGREGSEPRARLGDSFVLCDKHAGYADTVKLMVAVDERLKNEREVLP